MTIVMALIYTKLAINQEIYSITIERVENEALVVYCCCYTDLYLMFSSRSQIGLSSHGVDDS